MRLVNFDLISNPLNWITVILMVMIAGIAVTMLNDAASNGD